MLCEHCAEYELPDGAQPSELRAEIARLTSALAEKETENTSMARMLAEPADWQIEQARLLALLAERDAALTAQGERLKAAHNEGKLAAYRQALALNEAPYLTRGETLRKMIAELRAAAQDQRGGGDNG